MNGKRKAKSNRKANALTITVEEAAARLGVGRNQAYEAARHGQIPALRIGGRWLIPVAAFEKMLAGDADTVA